MASDYDRAEAISARYRDCMDSRGHRIADTPDSSGTYRCARCGTRLTNIPIEQMFMEMLNLKAPAEPERRPTIPLDFRSYGEEQRAQSEATRKKNDLTRREPPEER